MAAEAVEIEERQKPVPPLGGAGSVLRQHQKADTQSLLEWFDDAVGDVADCKIKIERKSPRTIGSENVGGVLETLDERPDDLEEYIRDTWGGGTFQIQLQIPNGRGGWQYGKAKSFRIAGPPKMNGRVVDEYGGARESQAVASPDTTLSSRAMDMQETIARQERERANRLEEKVSELLTRGGSADLQQISLILEPLRDQLTALRQQNADLQAKVIELTGKPAPTDPFRDRLLEQSVAGESQRLKEQQERYESRLDRMRDDHASELRQIRTSHADDIKRLEDRHDRAMADLTRNFDRQIADLTKNYDRQIADLKDAHVREIKAQEKAHATEVKTLEAANEAAKIALKNEADRVKGDLTAAKSELGTLRERKDKTPVEQMSELVKLKKSMDEITGAGDDADKPWYEKVADAAAPIAERIAERVLGDGDDSEEEEQAQQQPQQPQQQILPPKGKAIRNPNDGMIYIHRGGGMFEGPYTDEEFQQLRQQVQAQRQSRPQPRRRVAPPQAQAQPEAAEEQEGAQADEAIASEEPQNPRVAKPNPKPQLAAGSQQPIRPKPVRQLTPARPQAAPPKGRAPTGDEIKLAVGYLEGAYATGKKPEDVARTAVAVMPGPVLRYLRGGGVDTILANVANFKSGSPLTTQLGRKFVREIAKHIEGTA